MLGAPTRFEVGCRLKGRGFDPWALRVILSELLRLSTGSGWLPLDTEAITNEGTPQVRELALKAGTRVQAWGFESSAFGQGNVSRVMD